MPETTTIPWKQAWSPNQIERGRRLRRRRPSVASRKTVVPGAVGHNGLFATPSTVTEHLELAGGVLPSGGLEIIREQVGRIAAKGEAKLGFAFAFGLALALWSANAGMKAVIDALNVTYNEKEKRGFIKLNLMSLALTAGAILALLVAVGARGRGNSGVASGPINFRSRRMDGNVASVGALARADLRCDLWSSRLVPLRAKQRITALGVAFGGKRDRRGGVACGFGAAVLVLG
jgi:hypothetical protein